MLSPLAAWRVSLQRMRTDWPIVAAAWLITLLAATLLAAGPIYSDAVSLAGLQRVLADAPPREANIEASAVLPADEATPTGGAVERQVEAALGPVPAEIERSATSDSFALPEQPAGEVRDLAVLGFADGIEAHASLVAGRWPEPVAADEPVEVAVVATIAERLGWAVGDRLLLTSRLDESRQLTVTIAGVYGIDDAGDAFWWEDSQALEGMAESRSFRTFEPLLTVPEDFFARAVAGDVRVTWRAFPAFERLTLEQASGLRSRVAQLESRIVAAVAGSFPTVSTELDGIIAEAQRSLLVSRTGVLLLIIQLAILGGYAIVLTAGLLADHRRLDTALLRSRGAGPLQVASMALTEAVLIAIPAALAAPFLAAAALRLLNLAGPLAAVDLGIEPALSSTSFVVAGGAALGAALLLVVPAFLAARSFVDEDSGRSRFETRTMGQRLGIDIALLAVTILGFWQLRLYGAPLTESVQGTLGLDPLLVAAPAIGLLAGGVIALRVVPLLASLAEMLTRRGRRLVGSLGAQQMARRPLRYTRAALLLMLAVSMGVFAISYAATWRQSQEDQAAFQVGADVRLQPIGGAGTVPSWALATALDGVPGVERLMAIDRRTLRVSASAGQGELVLLDPAVAGDIVALRGDLVEGSAAELLAPLAAARPSPALVPIDGVPARMRLRAVAELTELRTIVFNETIEEFEYQAVDPAGLVGRSIVGGEVVVRDARGLIERFTAAAVAYDPTGVEIVVELAPSTPRAADAVAEIGGGLQAPLELVSVGLTVNLPGAWEATDGRVELVGVDASGEGTAWQAVDLTSAGDWSLTVDRNDGPRAEPMPGQVRGYALILGGAGPTGRLVADPLEPRPPIVEYVPASLAAMAEAELPIVVNDAFLEATATSVGDRIAVRLDGATRFLRVAGMLRSFPTTDPTRPLMIADLSTLGLLRFASSHGVLDPSEWWLAAEPDQGRAVADRIAAGPYLRGEIASRDDRALTLSADPVALGIIGALSLGFVVAGLFAVIGLAVSAAVSARQRRTEFALLRALGLSSSQLSGWLWLENAAIVAVSLAAGVGLGLVIGWVVLPYITVTQGAVAPFPPPIVLTPWASIGLLVAISTAALGLTVLVLARVLRRIGIGSVLRMGED